MTQHVAREATFDDQIATVMRVEAELKGRWVVQKCRYGIWAGININSIMPDDPVGQMWVPFSTQHTYETSGEAVEEMQRMQSLAPGVPMRVGPVQEDIDATYLFPRTGAEKAKYGVSAVTWGELHQSVS